MFQRQVIHTADIVAILGVSKRTAQRKIRAIREYFKKQPHHLITVDEFCYYCGVDRSIVETHFKALGELEYRKKRNA
jgi:transcriptional antiterminator